MALLFRWLIYSLAILVVAYVLPGVHVAHFWIAVIAAMVLGVLNAIIKPILILLTLPINILTLGLFTFVINALMILLTSSLVKEFHVDNFWWALLFSILLSIVSSIFLKVAQEDY